MRIDTNAINIALSPEQRQYARRRLWVATRVAAKRLNWAGLWLTAPQGDEQGTPIECRITVWLSPAGPVSVSHSADDALSAVDLAAARLEQALRRHLRRDRARIRTRRAPRISQRQNF